MAISQAEIDEMDKISGLSEQEFNDMDNIAMGVQPEQQQPLKGGVEKKYLNITPSGIAKGIADNTLSAVFAPLTAAKNNISVKEGFKKNKSAVQRYREENPTPIKDTVLDIAGYTGLSYIPGLQPVAAAKNATTAAKIGNWVLNSAKLGAIPGIMEGYSKGGFGEAGKGALTGSAVAGGLMAGIPVVGKVGKSIINNPTVKKGVAKTLEYLTSVPEEYTQRALEKELAGKTIFKGKFDTKDINENYKKAGKKAIEGFQDAKLKANQELNDATLNLNNLEEINRNQLANDIIEELDKYSYGGEANAALEQKGKDIYNYLDEIVNRKSNSDLHVTKRNIQNMIRSKYGAETGEGLNALKDVARISPEYEAANAMEQKLHDINDLLGGMNRKTIASKLRNAETDATIRSGYNQAAEDLNDIVAQEYKFLDDVKDLRAREALEKWFPGQGGGSGFGNLLRTGIIGGAPTAAAITHNPSLLGALGLISPKFTGQGTIKNLGLLNKLLEGNNFMGNVARRVVPAAIISGYGN